MTECKRNIELFYLLEQLQPDFRTIADFRKDNRKAIVGVFRAFVKRCLTCGLYSKELLSVDGSKFRAVNGRKNRYNQEILESKQKHIEERMTKYLEQISQEDAKEEAADREQVQEMQAKVLELQARSAQYQRYCEELETSGESQLLTTDPEARMMHSKDGFHCCYNVQTAVDATTHLIAGYEVTNHPNDQQVLCAFSKKVKADLGVEVLSVVADKGYDSQAEILSCIRQGILPYVGFRYEETERLCVLPYEPQEITEERRRSTKPEDIQACLRAGVLPRCYEGSHLTVEVRAERAIGCFHRGLDQTTVTCPMGHTLKRVRERLGGIEYACTYAALRCPFFHCG